MRKISLLAFVSAVVMSANANAEGNTATGTGHAIAKIVEPLTVTEVVNGSLGTGLHFGTWMTSEAANNVVLSATTESSVSATDGNKRISSGGDAVTPRRGKFEVKGPKSTEFTVSSITNPTLTCTACEGDTKPTMVTSAFKADIGTSAATLDSTTGKKDIYVGGTLQIGANQKEGEYTGEYTVTVSY